MFDRRFHHAVPISRVLLAIVGCAMLAGCNPMAAWTNNQSGKAYYRAGRFAEAREEFRRATADSPRNADYIHNYATASRRMGDPLIAEQAYRTALNLDPGHQPSYHGLAVTLKDTGRSDEAQTLLTAWMASQPYSEKPYIEMAWLQREMGDYTGAERSLSQALALRPGHPLALANLGQIYEDTGRTQLAMAAYQGSLASDWNQPPVTSRLARLRATGGTAVAIGPSIPMTAAVPGVPVTSLAPTTTTAEAPTPLPPYHQPHGSMASAPFRPNPNYGFAPSPFQPTPAYPAPNYPLASQPFRPSPNMPLASTPFSSTQAYMNVPSGPVPAGQTASPYARAPR